MESGKVRGKGALRGTTKKKMKMSPAKRHRLARFKGGGSNGTVEKVARVDVKGAMMTSAGAALVRNMGPQVDFDSQQSAYIELEATNELAELKLMVQTLTESVNVLKRELKVTLEGSYEIFLRAFIDSILNGVYKHARVHNRSSAQRVAWLESQAAANLFGNPVDINVHGQVLRLDARWVPVLEVLKGVSSQFSSTACHHATPLQVAIALEKKLLILRSFQTDLKEFFLRSFGETSVEVHQRLELGQSLPGDNVKFRAY
jgi:hypothetical protein